VFVPPPGLRFERLLGRGTTFEVAVVVAGDGTRLAAKRLRPSLRGNPGAAAALEREAAVLRLLRHPQVPRLVAFAADTAGPYLVETLLEGPSFRGLTEQTPARELPSSFALAAGAARILFELQSFRDAAGALGFVHGDISPDHLLVGAAGPPAVGLVDFGSAVVRGVPPALPAGRGTLPYVAPELCRGETAPSPSTDRYALAVVLGQLLTGARLCRASAEAAMLLEIGEQGHDVASLAALPASAARSLRAHLAFDPKDRPDDLVDLLDALALPG
jgi:serine/threonine protein kinase